MLVASIIYAYWSTIDTFLWFRSAVSMSNHIWYVSCINCCFWPMINYFICYFGWISIVILQLALALDCNYLESYICLCLSIDTTSWLCTHTCRRRCGCEAPPDLVVGATAPRLRSIFFLLSQIEVSTRMCSCVLVSMILCKWFYAWCNFST